MQPYLLLDAGGTVLFPDHQTIGQVIHEHGYHVPEERLKRSMGEFIRQYDERLRSDGQTQFGFYEWVLEQAGVEQTRIPLIVKQLDLMDAERCLWTYSYPWAHEALTRLIAQGYRMSIISNADGRVEMELGKAGLAGSFEKIFDSHIVGYAKPDVRLFQHAMTTLGLQPEQCLYVGDVYYVDVLGTNRSGIAAVHLDPYGLYDGWAGYHIPNVAALPDFLAQGLELRDERFFPLRQRGTEA